MHPVGDVRDGEELLREIYHAVRNGPKWDRTLLIITFDEHGGFWDHKKPPEATPTGDDETYSTRPDDHTAPFDFKRLGVRVPAILVSPWIRKNTIIQNELDHASILKWLEQKYHLEPMTERDKAAQSFASVLSLDVPRPSEDCPKELPDPWSGIPHHLRKKPTPKMTGLDNSFLHIAAMMEYHLIIGKDGKAEDFGEQIADVHERVSSLKDKAVEAGEYFGDLHERIRMTKEFEQGRLLELVR